MNMNRLSSSSEMNGFHLCLELKPSPHPASTPPRLCSDLPFGPRVQSKEKRGFWIEGITVGALRCLPNGLLNGGCMPGQTSDLFSSSFGWAEKPCMNEARIVGASRCGRRETREERSLSDAAGHAHGWGRGQGAAALPP